MCSLIPNWLYCKLVSTKVHLMSPYHFQITFHPNDHSAFQDLADEIKAFEGLTHDTLVKYYGCEVHRVRRRIIVIKYSVLPWFENNTIQYLLH